MLKVMAADTSQRAQAERIAIKLQAPLIEGELSDTVAGDLLLWVGADGLGLQLTGERRPAPVYVEFSKGAFGYRQSRIRHSKELIAKAVGVSAKRLPTVLDATAGFGRDAFVLASLGCSVTLLEKNPVVAMLLEDGMQRAVAAGAGMAGVLGRMTLYQRDAIEYLESLGPVFPEVVYLDPMFPPRQKAAKVKKEMQVLQLLAGYECDEERLLREAQRCAQNRVVVKRPKQAPEFAGQAASYSIQGKTSRFDVYLRV